MSPVKDESPLLPAARAFRQDVQEERAASEKGQGPVRGYSQTADDVSLRAMQLAAMDKDDLVLSSEIPSTKRVEIKVEVEEETKIGAPTGNATEAEKRDLADGGVVAEEEEEKTAIVSGRLHDSGPAAQAQEESKMTNRSSATGGEDENLPIVEANWSMFEKVCQIGEGANGTVYKVKALKTTIFSSEHNGRIELSNPDLVKKYGSQKQKLGINMHSSVEKSNKARQIDADQHYVIKEIDVSVLPQHAAFEAMQEIQIMAEVDSHFVVGYYDSFITE